MGYRVRISERAKREAKEHARFISENGAPEASERWIRTLYAGLGSLHELPRRFPRIPECDELRVEYRHFLHFSHRVIYRIDEETKTVFIVRVYHGSLRPLGPVDL